MMPGFDELSPQIVLTAVEHAFQLSLRPLVFPFPSYVNRVYGLEDENGRLYVVKFYRPGRWSTDGIEEEHRFIRCLVRREIPLAAPIETPDGDTLAEVRIHTGASESPILFALYPRKAGRLHDADTDDAWRRIGGLCGRMHVAGSSFPVSHRPVISPAGSMRDQLELIGRLKLLPVDLSGEWEELTGRSVEVIAPLFEGVKNITVHGDLHRGNILDRGEEGLILIDLDDMASGPAMQDLWLLLPGRYHEVGRQLALMADGYEAFRSFPWGETGLIEPLRLMRQIHFIAWCGRQRADRDFSFHFPDWGSRSWWLKEIEDLRDQLSVVMDADRSGR